MKILLSGGLKTKNIIDAIYNKFSSSGDEFTIVEYIDDINSIFSKGDYFDKAIITEQSITRDSKITDENEIKLRVNEFANTMAIKPKRYEYVFLSQTREMASLINDEILPILQDSVIIVKKPRYDVHFFVSLIVTDIKKFDESLVFIPEPTVVEDITIEDDQFLQDEDIAEDYTATLITAPNNTDWGEDENIDIDNITPINKSDSLPNYMGMDTDKETGNLNTDVNNTFEDDSYNRDTVGVQEVEYDNYTPEATDTYLGNNMGASMGNSQFNNLNNIPGFDEDNYDNNTDLNNNFGYQDNNNNNFGYQDDNSMGDMGFGYQDDNNNFGYQDNNNNNFGYQDDNSMGDMGFGYQDDNNTVFQDNNENNDLVGFDDYDNDSNKSDNDYQNDIDNNMYNNKPDYGYGYVDNGNQAAATGIGVAAGAALAASTTKKQKKGFLSKFGKGNNQAHAQVQPPAQVQAPVNTKQSSSGITSGIKGGVNIDKITESLRPFAVRGNAIVVTGCGGCGTSTIAYSLANVISQLGYEVLLVDMDTEGRTQNYISKDNYESMEPDGANLMSAVNSSTGITTHISMVKQCFRLLTMGLGNDTAPVEELLHKEKIGRFCNLCKSSHNFVIYDIPFQSAIGFLSDITYMADNLVLVTDASNWGVTKTMLQVTNIASDEMLDTIFSRAQLVFNKYRNLNKVLGKKVKTAVDITKVMDQKVLDLIGDDVGFHFEDLHIAGIVNDDPNFETGWFDTVQYSDTKKGQEIFLELLERIVLKK